MILLTKKQIDKLWIKYERADPSQQTPWTDVVTKAQLLKVNDFHDKYGMWALKQAILKEVKDE